MFKGFFWSLLVLSFSFCNQWQWCIDVSSYRLLVNLKVVDAHVKVLEINKRRWIFSIFAPLRFFITVRNSDIASLSLLFFFLSLFLLIVKAFIISLDSFQVENLAARMIKWLKVGGYVFFRESCFHQSGDSKRKYNPTHYREPRFYTKVCFECNYYSLFVPFKQLHE